MGGMFTIVPNEVDHNLPPDQVFALTGDKHDIAMKNGVGWVHRGGPGAVSKHVTFDEATKDKFESGPAPKTRMPAKTVFSAPKKVGDHSTITKKRSGTTY